MIDLYDHIRMTYPADQTEIHFTGPYKTGIDPQRSTVYKVWEALKKINPELPDLYIEVEKNIPHGSGLGGGSSDAAFFALMLKDEFSLDISTDTLSRLLGTIGADIPFFLHGPVSLVEGIGEIVTPVSFINDFKIVLYYPGFAISTAQVYKKFDLSLTPQQKNIIFKALLQRGCDFEDLSNCFYNDLERVVLAQYPRFKKVRNLLERSGCQYVQMSGSGSSFFGFYRGDIEKKILNELEGAVFYCRPL